MQHLPKSHIHQVGTKMQILRCCWCKRRREWVNTRIYRPRAWE